MGFCLFNNTAIAARWAQREGGLERVAILDWDVHHGNGTEAIFIADPSVLTISLHQDGLYPADRGQLEVRGTAAGEGFNVNVPLPAGTGDDGYLHALDEVVAPVLRAFKPELLLVGAGQDASATDPLGRMSITVGGFRALADRAVALAGELCGGKLVVMLEGGYSLLHLPLANLAILEGLIGLPPTFAGRDPIGVDVPAAPARRGARRRRGRGPGASRLMRHDAHGHWIAEVGSPPELPPLEGDAEADVVIVGGGYTGLWTAWHVLAAAPDARGRGPRVGPLRPRAERPQRRLRVEPRPEPALPDRGLRGARRRGPGSTPRPRPSTRSAPGARPRAWTRGTCAAASCACRPRPRRTASARTPSTARTWSPRAPPRRGRAATRRCSAAACSCRAARPCIRRGSRSGSASGCSRAGRGSTRAAAPRASARRRAAWPCARPAGACARAPRCWRSTRRPARSPRCATG